MSDDDLIRRGDVLALFTATDPNKVPGCRYAEHAQDYCGCAERIAAIRALPAVAREPEEHVCSTGKRGACLHPSHWPAPSQPTCLRCGRKAHGAMEVCPAPTTMDPAPRPNLDAVVDLVRRTESPVVTVTHRGPWATTSLDDATRAARTPEDVTRIARKAVEDYISGRRDSRSPCPACAGGRRA